MPRLGRYLFCLLLLHNPAPTHAQIATPQNLAERIAAEIKTRDESFAKEVGTIDDVEWVGRKLAHMVAVDQTVRTMFLDVFRQVKSKEENDALGDVWRSVVAPMDKAHTAALEALLARYQWISAGVFGKGAEDDAWLLVQHADEDAAFQKDVLARLERLYPRGEASPRHYAYLYDRIAANIGQPQRYGTQGDCSAPRTWIPTKVEDPMRLDGRRKSMGMEPMAEYSGFVGAMCP